MVFFGKRGEEWFGEQRQRFEFVAADGQSEHGNINGTGAEAFKQNGRDFFDDDYCRFGETFGKGRKHRGKKIWSHGWNYPDSNLHGDGIFAFDDVASSGFQFQNLLR